jgi:2-oxoglutarate ferredoxin oxidoreductase subunit beta
MIGKHANVLSVSGASLRAAAAMGRHVRGPVFFRDKKQLQALIKTAIAHNGPSVIDVVSPCVTFNDHEGSTKSYGYVKEHEEMLQDLSFVPSFEEIQVEIAEGKVRGVDESMEELRQLTE